MTQPQRYRLDPASGQQSHGHGLGRHVNHDPRSRHYPFRAQVAVLQAVYHERHIPIFDQGELGSCTGNAGLGILATGPYWADLSPAEQSAGPRTDLPWSENGAVTLYSAATSADDFPGAYPPDDTGSDGLSVAKVLTSAGIVPGYQHTFALADAVAALQQFPLLAGTEWTEDMFYPDAIGRIRPAGPVAGGHEWIVDEWVPAGQVPRGLPADLPAKVLSETQPYIGGTTSWGMSFGARGRFYLRADDFGKLLTKDGDVIVLTPPTAPAPQPEPQPTDDSDAQLAAAFRVWMADKGL